MTLSLTDAQWTELGKKLFLLQPASTTKLPKPTTTTTGGGLSAKLDFLKSDVFEHLGIGVIDLTGGPSSALVWLNNEGVGWRAGSTAKIAMLLAAVQLRDDVRIAQSFVSKPEDFDELFSSPKLWAMSPVEKAKQIARPGHAPRISSIFDLKKSPADFVGPNADTPDKVNLVDRITLLSEKKHLTWPLATDFDFTERLWLAGARSDNIAATTCISEIGLAYIKAVQRAYGLYDPKQGMKLLLAGPYPGGLDTSVAVSNDSTKIKYRPLHDEETSHVQDALKSQSGNFDDQDSQQATSAAALTAYMLALMNNELVAFGHGLSFGSVGCTTIRANLSHGESHAGTPLETTSFVVQGVRSVATVTSQITKIGLLGVGDLEPGPLNTEFAYIETQEKTDASKIMKYAVLVTGIKSTDNTPTHGAANITANLGAFVHQALAGP